MVIHPIVFEIIQAGLKSWTSQQTQGHTARLAKNFALNIWRLTLMHNSLVH